MTVGSFWLDICMSESKDLNNMIKKKVSVNNPQGVEYPEAVTADGLLVSAFNLDKECVKRDGMRFYFPGCEGDVEEEMQFIERKYSGGVTKFFRHMRGYIGDRNEPDRYLHNYSELRLKQRFDKSEKTGEFYVQYYTEKECPHYGECKIKNYVNCQGNKQLVLNKLNLRDYYDTCTIEKGEDKYIADLLLENSKKPIPKIMLEVFVTHECSEEKKNSGIRIIEMKIEKKEDADNEIIENAGDLVDNYLFMKTDGKPQIPPIKFYNFKHSTDFADYIKCGNFLLTKKENGLYADCKIIACNEIKDNITEDCAFSLLIPIEELKEKDGYLDFYEIGMAIAYDLGLKVRDCTLCYEYKRPMQLNSSCRLFMTYTYKDQNGGEKQIKFPYIFQLPYRCNGFDKSQQAIGCRKYSLDRYRILELVSMLKNMRHHMWVDNNLLPSKPIEKTAPSPAPQKKEEPRLLTPKECFDCPIYRDRCGHCLGAKNKEGKRYVVCDWKKPT